MLENFVSPVDATVVERLAAAGAEIAGRVEMNEFGVSGVFNKEIPELTEAVSLIKNGKADVILCNDYTGAISRTAAIHGLYYIHPTYGTVSRYGLIPAVTSMDQIGILCGSSGVGFGVLRMIAGYDPRDGVMSENNSQIAAKLNESMQKITVSEPVCKYNDVYSQIMQILCCAELGNNISRYDGIKFGHRSKEYNGLRELYTKSRTEAFGDDVKLAAVIGAMVLSQDNYTRYYDKAMRLRRMIKDSFDFVSYDVIKTCCPVLSRLCGLPSLTTPENVYIANTEREDILEALIDDSGEITI